MFFVDSGIFTGHNFRLTSLMSVVPFLSPLTFWSREIICLVLSGFEQALKAFERIQCSREIITGTRSRIGPNTWRELQSHGP